MDIGPHILKKILLLAGVRPVTFLKVCKAWKRVIDSMTLAEKYGYQLKLAQEAGVIGTSVFSFDVFQKEEEMYFMRRVLKRSKYIWHFQGGVTVYFGESLQLTLDQNL